MKGENMGFFSKQTKTEQNERYEQKKRERVAEITRLGDYGIIHQNTNKYNISKKLNESSKRR